MTLPRDPINGSYHPFYTKITTAEFDSLPWDEFFSSGPYPELMFGFTLTCLAFGTIGHGLLLVTLYKARSELKGSFFWLLAINTIFDWLSCCLIPPVLLKGQYRLCDRRYVCLANSCRQSCPSLASALISVFVVELCWCLKDTGRFVSALITINRVIAVSKPLSFRTYHDDKRVICSACLLILVSLLITGAGVGVAHMEFGGSNIGVEAEGMYAISLVRQDYETIYERDAGNWSVGFISLLFIGGFSFLLSSFAQLTCIVGWSYIVVVVCRRRNQHVQEGMSEMARGDAKVIVMGGVVASLTLISIFPEFVIVVLSADRGNIPDFVWSGNFRHGFDFTYDSLVAEIKTERFFRDLEIYVLTFSSLPFSVTFYVLLLFVGNFRAAFFKYVWKRNSIASVVPIS